MDAIHTAIDDHTRLAYVKVRTDDRGLSCARFLERAAAHFCSLGICRIEQVMTDNALNYRNSRVFHQALTRLGARHVLTRPYCP